MRYPYFLNTGILINEVDQTKTGSSHKLKFLKYQKTIDDITRMAREMRNNLNDRYKENISSEIALNRLHINWINRFNHANERRRTAYLVEGQTANAVINGENNNAIEAPNFSILQPPLPIKKIIFPVCPFGDFKDLIQIKNNFELLDEGRDMHHCVGSYVEDAIREYSYFYKMLAPERATVQFQIRTKKVSVVQFKLAHNKKPSAASYQFLHTLFDKK